MLLDQIAFEEEWRLQADAYAAACRRQRIQAKWDSRKEGRNKHEKTGADGPQHEWSEVAAAVSYLRGNARRKHLQSLLTILRGRTPCPADLAATLIAAIKPEPRWRQGQERPELDIAVPARDVSPNGGRVSFVLVLKVRRGRPGPEAADVVIRQDFLAAFGLVGDGVPSSDADLNRLRFAEVLAATIDSNLTLRPMIAEALDPCAASKFVLRLAPRSQRKRGRPAGRRTEAVLTAQRTRAAMDISGSGCGPCFPPSVLSAQASKRNLAPETLRKKTQRLAPKREK